MNAKKKPPSRKTVLFSVSFLSGVAIWAGFQSMADGVLSHPAFLVKEVEVQWQKGAGQAGSGENPGPIRFRLNPPTSIFRVELGALRHAFQRRYAIADVQRVERIFPNRVRAVIRPRHVVAQIKTAKGFQLISDDGIVVSAASSAARAELPVLLLDDVRGPLYPGKNLAAPGFWKAAELLNALRRDKGIAGHRVSSIRVNGGDLSLSLESGPEIRFALGQVTAGWQRLAGLIAQRPQVMTDAQYIDLRFEDPIIGNKPVDKKPRRKKA